ncbi:MAG: cytochrome c [Geminicoccaceae bacterium]
MLLKPLLFSVTALALLGAGTVAAQDIYQEREALMKGFGKQLNVVKGVVAEGKGTLADVVAAAQAIEAGDAKIPSMFPQGTNAGDSEALPVIWEQWSTFEQRATNMGQLAAKLEQAAASGDQAATLAAFAALGKNGCSGCHETFRQKKS